MLFSWFTWFVLNRRILQSRLYWYEFIQVQHTMFHRLALAGSLLHISNIIIVIVMIVVGWCWCYCCFIVSKQHPNWFIVLKTAESSSNEYHLHNARCFFFFLLCWFLSNSLFFYTFVSFIYLLVCSLPFDHCISIDVYSVTVEMLRKLLFVLCVLLIPWIGICNCDDG